MLIGEKRCQFCHGPLALRGDREVCAKCGTPYQEKPATNEPLPKCVACGAKIQFRGGVQRCVNDACGRPRFEPPKEAVASPLADTVEVNRGPDDSRRVPEQQRHQDRHSGRKDQRHHHSERPG